MTQPTDATITAVGRATAPAIVFLHGTRLTRSSWTAQLDALGGEFRAIAVDLPGHGSRAGERFTLDGAVDAVAVAIREQAAGGRAVVVGLSLGGYVAMALAAREPGSVRGLVLAGATAEPIGVRSIPYRALAMILERFDGPALVRLNTWFFRARYPPFIAEPIVAGGFWSAGGARAVRALLGQRFAPRLAAYPGPTLILNGDWDLLFRLSAGTFAAAARDARRVRLAGALHLSNLDRPAHFSEAVRRFARRLGDA
ncbi:MAG TPA: alpha/beta fold hydrolase [Candidatus Limnocylindrales bacterium]|nr:alpha/beta fold hydrolase [Candidatus Limnocylindrales bacterium]